MKRKKHLNEPASVGRKKVWGAWATAGFGLATVGGLLVVGICVIAYLASVGVIADTGFSHTYESTFVLLITLFALIAGVGLILVFIRLRRGLSIAEYLGLKRISLRTILVSLGLVIGLLGLENGLWAVLGLPPSENKKFFTDLYPYIWAPLFWIIVVVVGPVFEEVLFRGFLFQGFRWSRLSVMGTILLTSLVWSLAYLTENIYSIAAAFIWGIALGYMRYKSDSLWSPLIMSSCGSLIVAIQVVISLH
jgi:uncharacterized protein